MYIKNDDTIYAPATVPGTGAISVIRVSGPEALTIADKVIRCRKGIISDASGYTIKFGTIHTADDAVLDEVLVSIFRAPHSYTGENSVEISCHASSYIVSSVMELLFAAGARAAEPGEFTRCHRLTERSGTSHRIQTDERRLLIRTQRHAFRTPRTCLIDGTRT